MADADIQTVVHHSSTSPPILLVEDDGGQALLVQRVLARAGLTNPVRAFDDGQEAIDYLAGEGSFGDRTHHPLPVLVLLDIHVPRKTGLEILAWIRQQPEVADLPVIMLSGSSESSDIDRAFDQGADTYLVKPVGFDALLDAVSGLSLPWTIERRPSRNDG
jgi:CheY-like chemotaxis protein